MHIPLSLGPRPGPASKQELGLQVCTPGRNHCVDLPPHSRHSFVPSELGSPSLSQLKAYVQCVFLDKVFASFWHSTRKNLHENKLHVNWHTQFRFWHAVWLVKKKIHTSIGILGIEMSHTTRYVTLRWPFRRKCRCQLTSIFVFWKHHVTLWIWSWTSNEICQTYIVFTSHQPNFGLKPLWDKAGPKHSNKVITLQSRPTGTVRYKNFIGFVCFFGGGDHKLKQNQL